MANTPGQFNAVGGLHIPIDNGQIDRALFDKLPCIFAIRYVINLGTAENAQHLAHEIADKFLIIDNENDDVL